MIINLDAYSESQKKTAVAECVSLILEDPETNTIYSKKKAVYCSCALDGMYEMGITFKEI